MGSTTVTFCAARRRRRAQARARAEAAVSVAAGVSALTSAFPSLAGYKMARLSGTDQLSYVGCATS